MVGLTSRVIYKRLGTIHSYAQGEPPENPETQNPAGASCWDNVNGWKLSATASGLQQRSEPLGEF